MRNIHSNLTGIEDEELKKLVKKERFQRLRKKVFSIPFLTMFGIWILVYYQVTSHYHTGIGKTFQFVRGNVWGEVSVVNIKTSHNPVRVRVVR